MTLSELKAHPPPSASGKAIPEGMASLSGCASEEFVGIDVHPGERADQGSDYSWTDTTHTGVTQALLTVSQTCVKVLDAFVNSGDYS